MAQTDRAVAASERSMPLRENEDVVDVAVIGAGFGGLGAALALAERGASVALYEALNYPGGCASTFTRKKIRFESGATLFSGFAEGALFDRWIKAHKMAVDVRTLDPIVELRTDGYSLAIPPDRERFLARLEAEPGAPVAALRAFFAKQKQIADALWQLFDDDTLLPPLNLHSFARHALRSPAYLPILPFLGKPLGAVLRDYGLADFAPLRLFLDGVCQITVQASAEEAETPFAFSTLDYYFRGTAHVHGGVGVLAWEMARAVERLGGQLRFTDRVDRVVRIGENWEIHSRKGVVRARALCMNTLPGAAARLLGASCTAQERLKNQETRVQDGWGAAMLYRVVPPGNIARPDACHLELIADRSAPFLEGNHLFCSIAAGDEARAPEGGRPVTISTHVPLPKLRAMPPEKQGEYMQMVQDRMRATLAALAPELEGATLEMPGSPRTFERFTLRENGAVGGVPRRAGLANYEGLFAGTIAPNAWLVGDSVFPGQSTLATAVGGRRVAERIARSIPFKANSSGIEGTSTSSAGPPPGASAQSV
jgi:phytoene dehydrogenase-like protein